MSVREIIEKNLYLVGGAVSVGLQWMNSNAAAVGAVCAIIGVWLSHRRNKRLIELAKSSSVVVVDKGE